MATAIFVLLLLLLLFTENARSDLQSNDIDLHKEVLDLKIRLDQKDVENERLKKQLDFVTRDKKNKRLVVEMDVEEEILKLKARLDQRENEIAALKKQQDFLKKVKKSKRLVVEMDLEEEILKLKARLDQRENENEAMKKQLSSTYTRWGRTTCPGNGTDLVYSGYMAGTYHTGSEKGAGANYLCLSDQPTWDHYSETVNNMNVVTGVEYEFYKHVTQAHDLNVFFGSNIHDDEAPCSVCRSSRSTNVMIPGRMDCYPGWTKEYSGYLVGAYSGYDDASEYVCLDRRPETVVGSGGSNNDNMLFFVEARCGASLECPPYVNNRELACVVCSL